MVVGFKNKGKMTHIITMTMQRTPDDGVAAVVGREEENGVLPHARIPQRLFLGF